MIQVSYNASDIKYIIDFKIKKEILYQQNK